MSRSRCVADWYRLRGKPSELDISLRAAITLRGGVCGLRPLTGRVRAPRPGGEIGSHDELKPRWSETAVRVRVPPRARMHPVGCPPGAGSFLGSGLLFVRPRVLGEPDPHRRGPAGRPGVVGQQRDLDPLRGRANRVVVGARVRPWLIADLDQLTGDPDLAVRLGWIGRGVHPDLADVAAGGQVDG